MASQESKKPSRIGIWIASIVSAILWMGIFTLGASAGTSMILPLFVLVVFLVASVAYLVHLIDKSIRL